MLNNGVDSCINSRKASGKRFFHLDLMMLLLPAGLCAFSRLSRENIELQGTKRGPGKGILIRSCLVEWLFRVSCLPFCGGRLVDSRVSFHFFLCVLIRRNKLRLPKCVASSRNVFVFVVFTHWSVTVLTGKLLMQCRHNYILYLCICVKCTWFV